MLLKSFNEEIKQILLSFAGMLEWGENFNFSKFLFISTLAIRGNLDDGKEKSFKVWLYS